MILTLAAIAAATHMLAAQMTAIDSQEPLRIRIVGTTPCHTVVEGMDNPPADELLALFEAQPDDRNVVIEAPVDTPWRCVGGTIFLLQRAGMRNIRMEIPQ